MFPRFNLDMLKSQVYFNTWVPLSLAGTTMNTIALPFVLLFLYYACPNDGTFCLSGIDVASLVNMPIPYAPSNITRACTQHTHRRKTQLLALTYLSCTIAILPIACVPT